MPERELWPAGPGSEPVTHISSCDSMSDSYDFLSAEEKECLLFLEETIGSLDTEADSGLSTDESEPATTPQGFRGLPITQPLPQGKPETVTPQGAEPRTPTRPSSSGPPEPQGLGLRSGSYSLPRNIHIGRNQGVRTGAPQTNGHFLGALEGLVAEPGREQAGRAREPHRTPAGPPGAAPDLGVGLIPPPEAFQDAQPQLRGEHSAAKGPGEQGPAPRLRASDPPRLSREETPSEAMSSEASVKGSPGGPRPQPPPAEEAPLPAGGDPNAHLAPLTAPKPRKLPPNIVLKSGRSSLHSPPRSWLSRQAEAGEAGAASSSLQEQRKARREALEKLGLPQDQHEPGLHLGRPAGSLRLRRAPGQSPSPATGQPAAPARVPAAAPAAGKVPAGPPAAAPGRGSFPEQALTPAPPRERPAGKVPAAKSAPVSIPKAPKANSPLTPPKPDSGLTLQESNIPGLRQMNFKSNTLERSGVGLSSYLSAEKDPSPQTSTSLGKSSFLDKISPSVFRNSRSRPASLGTGEDFAGIRVGKLADLEQDPSSKRLSYQGQSPDKLPRPPCVSVKISPKGVPDEHRREALRKLGLLKE